MTPGTCQTGTLGEGSVRDFRDVHLRYGQNLSQRRDHGFRCGLGSSSRYLGRTHFGSVSAVQNTEVRGLGTHERGRRSVTESHLMFPDDLPIMKVVLTRGGGVPVSR